jgi:hypothetical protein
MEISMRPPAEVVGLKRDKKTREVAKKEWRRPALRKLPIAATAGGSPSKHETGDEGGGKSGDSALVS